MKVGRRIAGLLGAAVVLAACGDSGASRADVVAAIADDAVPAQFAVLANEADELVAIVGDWCSTGAGAAVREQVDAVRSAWNRVAPFWFGPVTERRSRFVIDPLVGGDDIDAVLASDEPVTATALRNLWGTDQRGLGALSVLANRVDGDIRSCEFGRANAALVAEESAALAEDWAVFGPTLGADDATANDAIEQMVNETLFVLVALQSGSVPGGDAKLAGVRWALVGEDGASGIAPLLAGEVVEQLNIEFDSAQSLDGDALKAIEQTVSTNIVSALGLSVQFSDADGDG